MFSTFFKMLAIIFVILVLVFTISNYVDKLPTSYSSYELDF